MQPGLFSTKKLRANGVSTRDIRRAVANGTLSRVRRGWYSGPSTPADVRAAATVGGRLTCLAALHHHGVWVLNTPAVHVRVSAGIAVRRASDAILHWTDDRIGPGVDDPEQALAMAAACTDVRALVIAADSIVNRRILGPRRVAAILGATPRGRRALALHDAAAESGIETIVRLALRRHRIRLRSQVVIPGVGRVDFVVGDRLVIEADGFDWHGGRAEFERDRERDCELVRRGYVVIRASYRRVTTDVDSVMLAVLAVVSRREHRWRPVHRSELSAHGYLIDATGSRGC